MNNLISRQDAIDAMYRLEAEDIETYGCSIPEGFDAKPAVEALEALPSAEPERHRGEWIEDGHERGFSECSKCGYIAVSVLSERHYNFCPNCGADMRGE